MIRTNQTVIGSAKHPKEIVVSLFPSALFAGTINPQIFRQGNKSSSAQQKYNRKISNMKMVNLIMNNFLSSDLFITLTYLHAPQTLESADKELTRFLNNLRRYYKKRGIEIVYVAVTGKGDKSGRFHHHMILKNVQGIVFQDIIERWSKQGIGPLGHVDIEAIRKEKILEINDKDDIEDVFLIAEYIVNNAISPTNKRFKQSAGLVQPLRVSSDDIISVDDYKSICDNPDSNATALMLIRKLCPDNDYELVDRRAEVTYIEGAGYYHVSARLRKRIKKDYVNFCMLELFNSDNSDITRNNYLVSNTNGTMTTSKAVEAWIVKYQTEIPNLDAIMDDKWQKSLAKYMENYISNNMSITDAIISIDTQIKSLNSFAKMLLTHIARALKTTTPGPSIPVEGN